jgi:hypothetical protein
VIWSLALGAVRTLFSISRRRGQLMDLRALRDLSLDERLELQQHNGLIGRWMTGAAIVGLGGLAAWGWIGGATARIEVAGLRQDKERLSAQAQALAATARDLQTRVEALTVSVENERVIRGQCEARWATAQATCTRVLGEGARRSETRIRRDAARKRGAVDAITKPQPVADPVPPPAPDPRSLLLAIQSAPDGVSSVSPAAPAADPAPELRGRTDPGP